MDKPVVKAIVGFCQEALQLVAVCEAQCVAGCCGILAEQGVEGLCREADGGAPHLSALGFQENGLRLALPENSPYVVRKLLQFSCEAADGCARGQGCNYNRQAAGASWRRDEGPTGCSTEKSAWQGCSSSFCCQHDGQLKVCQMDFCMRALGREKAVHLLLH